MTGVFVIHDLHKKIKLSDENQKMLWTLKDFFPLIYLKFNIFCWKKIEVEVFSQRFALKKLCKKLKTILNKELCNTRFS